MHIRKAEVAQDDALGSARVTAILARAQPESDNADVVRHLRRALAELTERPADTGPTRLERRLRADCETSIHRADTVNLGNNTLIRLDSRFVLERTVIPAGALLAENEDLARRYVALAVGPQDDADALADFLGDLVGAVDDAESDNVLGYADGLPKQKATFLGLFGLATVNNATSIVVGADNTLTTGLDLAVAPVRADDGIARAMRRHRASRRNDDQDDEEVWRP